MKRLKELKQKMLNWAFFAFAVTPVPNNGDPATDIVEDITQVKDAIFEVMGVVGLLFIAFGIVKAVRANSKGMDDGIDKGIGWAIAGIVMASISGVMAWLGY